MSRARVEVHDGDLLPVDDGAVYDALVGAAARQHGRSLVSCDGRARTVYKAVGVRVRLTG